MYFFASAAKHRQIAAGAFNFKSVCTQIVKICGNYIFNLFEFECSGRNYLRRVRFMEKASEKQWEQLGELLGKYRGTKGSTIPVLQQAQDIFGYLPKDVLI